MNCLRKESEIFRAYFLSFQKILPPNQYITLARKFKPNIAFLTQKKGGPAGGPPENFRDRKL